MCKVPKHKSVIIVEIAISLVENPRLITTELLNSCDDEGKKECCLLYGQHGL